MRTPTTAPGGAPFRRVLGVTPALERQWNTDERTDNEWGKVRQDHGPQSKW
jgi:hypothetical protein